MVRRLSAVVLLGALATALYAPARRRAPPALTRRTGKTRGPGGGDLVDDDRGEPDDDAMAELRARMLAEELNQRKAELREGGSNRLAAQYVQLLTEKHPSELVGSFYKEAPPQVQVAMQDAILGLLGAGAVDVEFTTTGSRIAELCFRLQMTGYMLRNAEYVLALQDVLRLAPSGRTPAQLRAAFQRVDSDNSGSIDVGEVRALFDEVYGEVEAGADKAAVADLARKKKADVDSFLRFFDRNEDGRISFDEFCAALGGADASPAQLALEQYGGAPSTRALPAGEEPPGPRISGELRLGDRVVEASDYVAELKAEAARLKTALAATARTGDTSLAAIGQYVQSLAPEQRDLLVASMTPDARDAAEELVSYVLSEAGGERKLEPDQQVTLERRVLDQICRWQMVVGYRLRELEASGEAKRRLG